MWKTDKALVKSKHCCSFLISCIILENNFEFFVNVIPHFPLDDFFYCQVCDSLLPVFWRRCCNTQPLGTAAAVRVAHDNIHHTNFDHDFDTRKNQFLFDEKKQTVCVWMSSIITAKLVLWRNESKAKWKTPSSFPRRSVEFLLEMWIINLSKEIVMIEFRILNWRLSSNVMVRVYLRNYFLRICRRHIDRTQWQSPRATLLSLCTSVV